MRALVRAAITAGVVASAAIAGTVALRRSVSPPTAKAGLPAPPPPPAVARLGVLIGEIDGDTTDVGIAAIAPQARAPIQRLGSVRHPRGSARRGAMLPGRAPGDEVALVVVSEEGDRRSSFVNALFRVDRHGVTRLCGGLAKASTPLVTPSGRVFVERGTDGPEPSDEDSRRLVLRTDALTTDEVDPTTGALTTLWRGNAYEATLAVALPASARTAEELAVYVAGPTGAGLFAIDTSTGRQRAIAPSLPPWARDFSYDATHGAIVFVDLVSQSQHTYRIVALSPVSGAMRSLFETPNEHSMPFAIPGGDVALSSDGDHGLAIRAADGRMRVAAPLGEGSDAATHATRDGRWIAVRHTPAPPAGAPGASDVAPPQVVAMDVANGASVRLDVPTARQVRPIGFVEDGP